VRGYAAVLSARFRTLIQYRAAALAGFGTQLFWGLIRLMIFDAFYRSSTAPQPMSQAEVVTYVWLGQATLALVLGGVDPEIRTMVRTGTVAYDLLRPLDLYGYWYSRAVADRTAPMALRAGPVLLSAALFFGLGAPPSGASALGWAAATAVAVLLAASIWMLMNISLLWTVSGDGVARFFPAVIYTLSGILIPLPLLPDWTQAAVNALPFRGLADVPFRIYMGHIPPEGILPALIHQLLWTAALVLLGRAVLDRARRHLVVQGG
jgi:ABC-2 type transport system permease protein